MIQSDAELVADVCRSVCLRAIPMLQEDMRRLGVDERFRNEWRILIVDWAELSSIEPPPWNRQLIVGLTNPDVAEWHQAHDLDSPKLLAKVRIVRHLFEVLEEFRDRFRGSWERGSKAGFARLLRLWQACLDGLDSLLESVANAAAGAGVTIPFVSAFIEAKDFAKAILEMKSNRDPALPEAFAV